MDTTQQPNNQNDTNDNSISSCANKCEMCSKSMLNYNIPKICDSCRFDESMPTHVDVKNKYPYGGNLIKYSHGSIDIKTPITPPKFIMPPWLPCNIEPDLNIKPLF